MKKAAVIAALFTLFVGFSSIPAMAVPIVFNLGFGGTVSYGGGDSAFTTTNGAVTQVGNGSTNLSIAGGDLDFATGNYIGGGATTSGFENNYAAGGSVTIHGDIGSGSVLLMQGNFADTSTFTCCSGTSPVYASSFDGLLDISYVDADLAAALGFNPPASGGSIAQVEIFFGTSPTATGVAFSGTQGGGALSVSEVPEPGSLLLLGSGLAGFAIWGRKKLAIKR
ncbi:PEP-CTERM sorting domain-containing protein [Candidatus Manganitrophus noduliformans]|nr:PEP-CTERM sorting domain-containing protein [Candidatus Manganitrophus noduliformans]